MTSTETLEALKKIDEIEVQWDNRRKVISVFNFQNHKVELEVLGFDCSSPMFANKVFEGERAPQLTLREKYEAMSPEEQKRADDQFGEMVTG